MRRCVLLAISTLMVAGCWAQPGFDAQYRANNPFNGSLTTATAPDLTEAWRVTRPGTVSSPLIIGNATIITYGNTVESLDTATGARRWATALDINIPPSPAISLSIGEPVRAADGFVHVRWDAIPYFGEVKVDIETGAMTAVAVDSMGGAAVVDGSRHARLSWTLEIPNLTAFVEYGPHRGLVYSGPIESLPTLGGPMVLGDRVFVSRDNQVLAWDFGTCMPTTTPVGFCSHVDLFATDGYVGPPVALNDDRIVVVTELGSIVVDAQTLDQITRAPGGSPDLLPPAVAAGRAFAPSYDDLRAWPIDCTFPCFGFTGFAVGGEIAQQPAVGNDVLFVARTDGALLAFDRDCTSSPCAPTWQADATPGSGAPITAGPVVASGKVAVVAGSTLVAFST